MDVGEDRSCDHDNDGLDDAVDDDDDNDDILDVDEIEGVICVYRYDYDNDGIWDMTDIDDDNDGLSDWFEINDGNPLTGQFDHDNDGLDDNEDDDDDNDGIEDIYEFWTWVNDELFNTRLFSRVCWSHRGFALGEAPL